MNHQNPKQLQAGTEEDDEEISEEVVEAAKKRLGRV